jgi:hypothetical protein
MICWTAVLVFKEVLHDLDKVGGLVRLLHEYTNGEVGVKCNVAGSFQIYI